MKRIVFIWVALVLSLTAEDNLVDQDILDRFNLLCTRIEWVIKSDHEYYMMDVIRAYGLQSVRNENDNLYEVLLQSQVYEKNLLNAGKSVLKELRNSQKQKILILPEIMLKSKVTIYSFSSVN